MWGLIVFYLMFDQVVRSIEVRQADGYSKLPLGKLLVQNTRIKLI